MCTKNEITKHASQNPTTDQDRRALLNDIIGKTGDIRNTDVTLRTNSTYTVSEAIENIEEALNYAYCRPGTPLQNTIILSDTLIMEVISDVVTEAEIADMFDEASEDLGNLYHALSLTNKQTWAFSVREYGSVENDELPIIVQLEVAYGDYITERIEYGENDDYSYHFGGGTCNSSSVDGAPEILSDNLKYAFVLHTPNQKKYWKRPEYVWICNEVGNVDICNAFGIPTDLYFHLNDVVLNQSAKNPQNWNNINDWRLFRQDEGITANYDKCLSGDVEMPFQEEKMGDLITYYNPTITYYPANLWVGSFEVLESGDEVPFHNMVVVYYQKVVLENEDDKIALPCSEC